MAIDLPDVIYVGPLVPADHPLRSELPAALAALLESRNGFIAFAGGLHVRGLGDHPDWHSLERAWRSEHAFHQRYRSVEPTDVPFGEDCVGDQFLLRGAAVLRLMAETDEIEQVADDLNAFLERAVADPSGTLGIEPLLAYLDEETLQPGELLSIYPPFCTAEAAEGVSIDAIPTLDRQAFLADFAESIRDLGDGDSFTIEVVD